MGSKVLPGEGRWGLGSKVLPGEGRWGLGSKVLPGEGRKCLGSNFLDEFFQGAVGAIQNCLSIKLLPIFEGAA